MVEQSPHQEIAKLERLLEEKRQALVAEGKAVEEREAFGEVFREQHGATLTPPAAAAPQLVPSLRPDELAEHAAALKNQDREAQVESLIALAFSKGIRAAADVARHAAPWLMDELHDTLADRYYQQLIESRQLKAL